MCPHLVLVKPVDALVMLRALELLHHIASFHAKERVLRNSPYAYALSRLIAIHVDCLVCVPIFFLELQIRVYPDLIKIIANLNEPKDQGLFNNNPILQKID